MLKPLQEKSSNSENAGKRNIPPKFKGWGSSKSDYDTTSNSTRTSDSRDDEDTAKILQRIRSPIKQSSGRSERQKAATERPSTSKIRISKENNDFRRNFDEKYRRPDYLRSSVRKNEQTSPKVKRVTRSTTPIQQPVVNTSPVRQVNQTKTLKERSEKLTTPQGGDNEHSQTQTSPSVPTDADSPLASVKEIPIADHLANQDAVKESLDSIEPKVSNDASAHDKTNPSPVELNVPQQPPKTKDTLEKRVEPSKLPPSTDPSLNPVPLGPRDPSNNLDQLEDSSQPGNEAANENPEFENLNSDSFVSSQSECFEDCQSELDVQTPVKSSIPASPKSQSGSQSRFMRSYPTPSKSFGRFATKEKAISAHLESTPASQTVRRTSHIFQRTRKRQSEKALEENSTPKRLKSFLSPNREDRKLMAALDSVLSDAKKKSRERGLRGSSSTSRRELLTSFSSQNHDSPPKDENSFRRMINNYTRSESDSSESVVPPRKIFPDAQSSALEERNEVIVQRSTSPPTIILDSFNSSKNANSSTDVTSRNNISESSMVSQSPDVIEISSSLSKNEVTLDNEASGEENEDSRKKLKQDSPDKNKNEDVASIQKEQISLSEIINASGDRRSQENDKNSSQPGNSKQPSTSISKADKSDASQSVEALNQTKADVSTPTLMDMTVHEVQALVPESSPADENGISNGNNDDVIVVSSDDSVHVSSDDVMHVSSDDVIRVPSGDVGPSLPDDVVNVSKATLETSIAVNSAEVAGHAQSDATVERAVQGSIQVTDAEMKSAQDNLFDIAEFFNDENSLDAIESPNPSDSELDISDFLPEVLEDAARQNRKRSQLSDSESEAQKTDDEGVMDVLPDLSETPRSKRRRLEQSQDSTEDSILRSDMMSDLLNRSLDTPNDSFDADWIKELDELVEGGPRSPGPTSRLRSLDSTSAATKNLSALLADTTFSDAYKKHGASLKKLVKDKMKEDRIEEMEKVLISDLEKGGFRKIFERQEDYFEEVSVMNYDEDTRKALDLMKKDWGTLPHLSTNSRIFKGGQFEICVHMMPLTCYFMEDEFQGMSCDLRQNILRFESPLDAATHFAFLIYLLKQPETKIQTSKWILDAALCYPVADDICQIVQSHLNDGGFSRSPFTFSQFKSTICRAGIRPEVFGFDEEDVKRKVGGSICPKCQQKPRKKTPKGAMNIIQILGSSVYLCPESLSSSDMVEYITLLLLVMQEEKFASWQSENFGTVVGFITSLEDWDEMKHRISQGLIDSCKELNIIQDIVCRLRFKSERTHELSRLMSFSLLSVHIFGNESSERSEFDDMEALIDLVEHFNPDNIELVLRRVEETSDSMAIHKKAYYYMSLLLPLLNNCIGNSCEDQATFSSLDRIWAILRTMNKRIRDNGAIYRSQVKYELSLFTKNLRQLIQKAPKQNKASIFKYLRSAPVVEEMVDNGVKESEESSDSEDENQVSYTEDDVGKAQETETSINPFEYDDEFKIAESIKKRIIGASNKR